MPTIFTPDWVRSLGHPTTSASRELDHNLPQSTRLNNPVRGVNLRSRKASLVEKRPQLTRLSKRRCLGK
jgi:hypothetical protein